MGRFVFVVKSISIKLVLFHTCFGSSGRAVTGWGPVCECYYSNPDWLPGEMLKKILDIWKVQTTANSLRPGVRNQWVVQRLDSDPSCPSPVFWSVGTHTGLLSFFRRGPVKISTQGAGPLYFLGYKFRVFQGKILQCFGTFSPSVKVNLILNIFPQIKWNSVLW